MFPRKVFPGTACWALWCVVLCMIGAAVAPLWTGPTSAMQATAVGAMGAGERAVLGVGASSREGNRGADGYAFIGAHGLFQARNVQHAMDFGFRSAGFDLLPERGGNTEKLSFELLGIGRADLELLPGKGVALQAEQGVLVADHGSFRMEFRNSPAGMRHDIVVAQRPQGDGPMEARLQVEGGLVPVQEGPDAILFHALDQMRHTPVPKVRYSGLLVWDADGDTLSARMELRDDLVVLVVDDEEARYPVTIDPLSTTANTTIAGTQAGATWGSSVATAGDVNGDGYSDLIVGEALFDGVAGTDAGRARIFLGSATGLSNTPAWTVEGLTAGARCGASVSSAGDLNGDGVSDVVIGAPGHNGHGAAYVFLGVAGAGPSTVPTAVWTGDAQAASEVGFSVALAGDVDNDGRSDVLVGAPKYDAPPAAVDRGRVYCYHGSTMAIAQTLTGTSNSAQFGFSVAGAGDLNGDGVSDVAVGAPYQNSAPGTGNGFVYIFQGASGAGLPATATINRRGVSAANFGFSLSSAGDMNGDGRADLLIGAPGTTSGAGAVHLFLGDASTMVGATAASTLAGTAGDRLGYSVGLAGDVNGDGYADVIVGKPDRSSGSGRVEVYRGSATVALDAAHLYWSRNGSATGGRMGAAVATAGDVNGDGFNEVVAASPDESGQGSVRVYHGTPDLPIADPQWSVMGGLANERLGRSVASAGDVNGDGYGDVIIGISGYGGNGAARLYLGSSSGLSGTPAWTAVGETPQDLFGTAVASAGDVNGDGYADVLVGAPGFPSYTWRGKAYLYLGSPSGLEASPAWTYTGATLDERVGWSLTSGGDVNGDGYSDVVIGAYMFNSGQGKVYAFHGSAAGLSVAPVWTVLGTTNSFFGACVSLAGDVNGDGYGDVAVGAQYHDGPAGENEGAVFVYNGSATGLSVAPDWTVLGGQHGAEFGGSVSYAGDVNGDGYSDLVVGAHQFDNTYAGSGRVYVFHGAPFTGLSTSPATVLDGVMPSAFLGSSVCSAGDVNADGYSDIIVGSPGLDQSWLDQGAAQVFLGSSAGVTTAIAAQMIGPVNGAAGLQVGDVVALAGDVDGDGYSDLIAGSWTYGSNAGALYLYEGNGARGQAMSTFQYRSDLTTPVRSSNSTFASGCDWGIGQFARSSMGRSRAKLVWHTTGHGPTVPIWPFDDNNNLVTGEAAAWTDLGLSGVLLKQVLGVLPASTGQPAWRARLRHHPATALDGRMFGRWHMQGVHELQLPGLKLELGVCGPLPVTLLWQRTVCEDGVPVIEWATAAEVACASFMVQRSWDLVHWEPVEQVPCHGTSTTLRLYRVEDHGAQRGGTVYHRLVQVDVDGTAEGFDVLVAPPCAADGKDLEVWPVPFRDALEVRLFAPLRSGEVVNVELFDMAGRQVFVGHPSRVEGDRLHVEGLGHLPPGAYTLVLKSSLSGPLGRVRSMHF